MSILERKHRHKESLRREILDVARELIMAEGFEGISLRRIADRIEYSPTTIYQYFEDKAEIVSMLVIEAVRTLNSQMILHLEVSERDAFVSLLGGMRSCVDFAIENPRLYRVAFLMDAAAGVAVRLKPGVHEEVMVSFGILRKMLERASEAGWIRAGNIGIASFTVWCGIHGLAAQLATCGQRCSMAKREAFVRGMFRTLLTGMGVDEATLDGMLARTDGEPQGTV